MSITLIPALVKGNETERKLGLLAARGSIKGYKRPGVWAWLKKTAGRP